jgi:hypothetical protein
MLEIKNEKNKKTNNKFVYFQKFCWHGLQNVWYLPPRQEITSLLDFLEDYLT